jgi:hypothetical protein
VTVRDNLVAEFGAFWMSKIEIVVQSRTMDHSLWAGAEPATYTRRTCMHAYCNTRTLELSEADDDIQWGGCAALLPACLKAGPCERTDILMPHLDA